MSADQCCDLCIKTKSAEETFQLGLALGKNISEPCIIGLQGDLGAGKTAFIQGLARGLGVPEQYRITSPSYTIINQYPGRLAFFHVDLYRVEDPEEIEQTGLAEILSQQHVTAVEWAEHLPDEAPKPDIVILISTQSADTRKFRMFFYGPRFLNLVENLKKFEQGRT